MRSSSIISILFSGCRAFQSSHIANFKAVNSNNLHRRVLLQMQPSTAEKDASVSTTMERRRLGKLNRNPRTSLLASTLDSTDVLIDLAETKRLPRLDSLAGTSNFEAASKVLSASLLVTGSTVGSSMFTLPDAIGGVGMVSGSVLVLGIYACNLVSGLLISEVAIKLHESSDCDVPSSFKDFADSALQNESTGNAIAVASVLINGCVLAFGAVNAGNLVTTSFPSLGLDPTMATAAFTVVLAGIAVTQSNKGLEKISNAAVIVLFSSFASILLPSLAQVHDPMGTVLAPGTHPGGFGAAMSAAAPLLVTCAIYQNIVPSLTKLLNYDRVKSTIAITIGSFLPIAMYLLWCFVVLGGGLDGSISEGGGAAFTTFSAAALVGSSVACTMSLSEEFESILVGFSEGENDGEACPTNDTFSVPAVALAVTPPAIVALANAGGELTGGLHFCGAFVSPFLYGILPIMLIQKVTDQGKENTDSPPGFLLILLGSVTLGFIGQEIVQDLSNFQGVMS